MKTKLLYNHLIGKLPVINNLKGSWLERTCGYEEKLCKGLDFKRESTRYTDCNFNGMNVELKKGRHQAYFDEIRYAEMLLNDYNLEAPTVFFRHKKINNEEKITNMLIMETNKIIDLLGISHDHAKYITDRHQQLGNRGYYCQQTVRYVNLCGISEYIIDVPVVPDPSIPDPSIPDPIIPDPT